MDKISKERRSWNMSRIRSSNTSLELEVRKALHALGFRYRLRSSLPGHPDIVFPKQRVALFINGCFWHSHGCKLSTTPTTRHDFWAEKLGKNKNRDKRVNGQLKAMGWKVVTLWECRIMEQPEREIARAVRTISSASS